MGYGINCKIFHYFEKVEIFLPLRVYELGNHFYIALMRGT